MLLAELIAASSAVAGTRSRLAKTGALAAVLRRLPPGEVALGVAYLSGETRQGKAGIGYASLEEAMAARPVQRATLELAEVDRDLETIAALRGPGSAAGRRRTLGALFARATAEEQDFLARLLLGELRQGALEGVMLDAIASASGIAAARVRSAAMRAGGLPAIAQAALVEGEAGLARFALTLFRPVQPMLAQPAEDVADAIARLGRAGFEWKLDGVRIQVHKSGDEIRVYTRNLNEVTPGVPEIVAAVRGAAARELILDGETIALRADGTPYPFQETMRRFGRRDEADPQRGAMPLSAYFFDCLLAGGEDLTAKPAHERFDALAGALPPASVIPRIVTAEVAEAQAFFDASLARGHEGLMAKSLAAPYEAGGRGSSWLKIKEANTLDLVVIAAEWGNGRRRGWLSNLHLGALDPDTGSFVMLGKTFKGMTDKMLGWQTGQLLSLETAREGHIVHVRPALVVEIAYNEIQESRVYPGGLALRFARVKRYREGKPASQADTIAAVRALYEGQLHRGGGGRR